MHIMLECIVSCCVDHRHCFVLMLDVNTCQSVCSAHASRSGVMNGMDGQYLKAFWWSLLLVNMMHAIIDELGMVAQLFQVGDGR